MTRLLTVGLALLIGSFNGVVPLVGDDLVSGFANPPDSAKPWVIMLWLGETTPEDVTMHLEELKSKGVGGVLLFDFGAMPESPFLSDSWRELFRHTVKEADRLGLELAVNACGGYPVGGRWISLENSSWMAVSSETTLQGPQEFSGKLPHPFREGRLYADVAVHAFPLPSGIQPGPIVTVSSNPQLLPRLLDGNYNTGWRPKKPGDAWILVDFGSPRTVDWAWIDTTGNVELETSNDGQVFRHVTTVVGPRFQPCESIYQAVPPTKARWFRVVFRPGRNVRGFALGTKIEVEHQAVLAAKRALTNPLGVYGIPLSDQVAIVRKDLTAIPGEVPLPLRGRVDLTSRLSPDGVLRWDVPPGAWKIVRLGRTTTGIGAGDGLLTDYLSPAATEQNFEAIQRLIDDAGSLAGKTFTFLHEENVELSGVYSWTPRLLDEFRCRRGYDPTPYLAAMAGQIVESLEITDRFLTDVRRTIADCVADYHYGRWADLAHARGMKVRAEAGGQHTPRLLTNDGLMNLGRVDVPVAEFWENWEWKENQHDPRYTATALPSGWDEGAQNVNAKQAASAAHVYGKRLVACESFSSSGPRKAWGVGPADLLPYANIAFCEGLNAFYIQTSTTSGPTKGKPGLESSFGTYFNPNITWWEQSGAFLQYLARCQHLLQQGLFAADVLYYTGDEAPNFVPPKNIPSSRGFGYDYDACNTEVLLSRLSVHDGRIVLPDGMFYRVLVLPERPVLPITAAKKIQELVAAGATVIGPKPQRTPGLTNYPQSELQLRAIADEVWGDCDGKSVLEHPYGKGRVVWGRTEREVLERSGVPVDFACEAAAPNALFDFIHRRDGQREIYFVANRRQVATSVQCIFRVSGKQPELWDPVTGKIRDLTEFHEENGRTIIPMRFEPYQGLCVVFQTGVRNRGPAARERNFVELKTVQEIVGPWILRFDPKWGGPKSVVFEKLDDWTKRPEPGIKYYSGKATYERVFDLPEAPHPPGRRLYLDLGKVKNVAEVRLNGKALGVVWTAPWRVEITATVKPTGNRLEIDVVNLWPNRLIGDAGLPPEKRLTRTNITKFKKDSLLLESGLLGPVTLRAREHQTKPPVAQNRDPGRCGNGGWNEVLHRRPHGGVCEAHDGPLDAFHAPGPVKVRLVF